MKVSHLEGDVLDRFVARAEGLKLIVLHNEYFDGWYVETPPIEPQAVSCYSTRWDDGGPIIGQSRMTIEFDSLPGGDTYTAIQPDSQYFMSGKTHLIAAMRCYIASKFGEEVADE